MPNATEQLNSTLGQANTALSGLNQNNLTSQQQATLGDMGNTLNSIKQYLDQQSANATPGISSSSMVTGETNRMNARDQAVKNLNQDTEPNRNPTFGISTAGEVEGIFDKIYSSNKDYQDLSTRHFQEGMSMIDRIYDTALARTDMNYKNLMDDIKRNQKKAIEVATFNAIALNPYSQSRGAQTAANFNNAINNEYERQAQNATEKYQMAQRELADGNAKAAMQLKQSAQQDLMQANQQFQQSLMDLYKEALEQQRFETNLESQEQRASADDFRLGLTAINYSPEDIDAMVKDGSIYRDPTFLSGVKAHGIQSADGIIQAMKQGSLAQQKQFDLQAYRERSLELSSIRTANAMEKQTNAQMAIATRQQALAAAQATGASPNDFEYAYSAAMATVGSPYQLTAADRDKYAAAEELVGQLVRFDKELSSIKEKDTKDRLVSIFNYWTKNPLSDDMQLYLARQIPITYKIMRGIYGEGARMSDQDADRAKLSIGSGLQSAKVRQELKNSLLRDLESSTTIKLRNDALAGLPVAGYADVIANLHDEISRELSSSKTSNSTTGLDYSAYQNWLNSKK